MLHYVNWNRIRQGDEHTVTCYLFFVFVLLFQVGSLILCHALAWMHPTLSALEILNHSPDE